MFGNAVVTLTLISRAFAGQAQVSNTQPRRDAQTGTILDIHVSFSTRGC